MFNGHLFINLKKFINSKDTSVSTRDILSMVLGFLRTFCISVVQFNFIILDDCFYGNNNTTYFM